MKTKIFTTVIILLFVNPLYSQTDSLFNFIFKTGNDLKKELSKFTELSDEKEMEYGDKIAKEYNKNLTFSSYKQSKVNSIGAALLQNVSRKKIEYKFKVIDSDVVNAFSIAGGNIYITTGMLNFVKSDEELAFVIGHEIGHVDKKHCMQMVQYAALANDVGGSDAEYYAQIAYTIANTPFNKYQEYEADEAGAYLCFYGSYNPSAGIDFFERLSKESGEEKEKRDTFSDILRTHPYSKDRSEHLLDYINNNLK